MKIISGITYCPKCKLQNGFFYPVIEFFGAKFGSQIFWLNTPQKSRGKALTMAKNYINNL